MCLGAPGQAAAYIYSANDSPSGIARTELSGTHGNNSFLPASTPAGVAVDSQHIYWATTATNSIGRANLNGTKVNQTFMQFTSGIGLGGVAVDSGHIYWTEANGGGAGDGAIGRANLDGTSPTTSFVSGLNHPAGIAINSSRIYWSNFAADAGSIGDATLNPNGTVTAITNSFVTTGTGVVSGRLGLAVDGTFLYWANFSDGSIGRAGLSGAGPSEPVQGLDGPGAVAVDAAHIYWTSPPGNAIGRSNLNGSSAAPHFISGAGNPEGIAVDGLATPPSTAITLSPAAPNGTNGWYTGAVQVQAIGTAGGWPVNQTRCVADPGAAPASFSDLPATACGAVASDGRHSVFAATRDTQNGTSPVVSASFKIDSTRPTLACERAPAFPLGAGGATVRAAVTDHESGPLSATVSASVKTSSLGKKTVTLSGSDLAGNKASARCGYTVTLERLKPEPKLTARFRTRGGATAVTSMRISGVPGRAKVTVKCSGTGCSFASLTAVVNRGKNRATDLASVFHGRELHAGARVAVQVTQAHKNGRKWLFSMHAGGQRPTETISWTGLARSG